VQDIAVWAVPFGLVGGRLYHVATDHERYFGASGDPWQILYVWRGGLGVWGSIFLGAVGAMICAYRKGIRIAPMVDALAPGLLVAQAIGRWGELVQPGAVRQAHRPAVGARDRSGAPAAGL
jgi:prolipoprotein diacylglyceryltransferase